MSRVTVRHAVLFAALAATAALSWWGEHADDSAAGTVEALVREAPRRSAAMEGRVATPSDEAPLDLERLTKRELAGTDVDAFRAKSWYVPPPPPPPEPPPKPTAPPLPFQYMGKTEEVGGGKAQVYLAQNNEFYTVSVGEKFASSYRLEKIDRAALVIRYLPLSIDQTLPIAVSE